jgi:hypothetical protein
MGSRDQQPVNAVGAGGLAQAGTAGTSAPIARAETGSAAIGDAHAGCLPTASQVGHPDTKQAFIDLLIGEWQLCSGSSVFCTSADLGLAIYPDGTWARRLAAPSDASTFAVSGTWEILEISEVNGPRYQLNLDSDQGGIAAAPAITADGSGLRLDNEGSCAGDYAKATAMPPATSPMTVNGVAVEATPAPVHAREVGAAGCPVPASRIVSFESQDAFVSSIAGYWTLCGSQSVFCSNEEVGIEITADAHWYKLYADSSGLLWRGLGWGRRGDWQVVDTSSFNGAGSYQLNLDIDGSGTVITHPEVAGDGSQLHLNNNGVCIADYIQAGH